MISMYGWGKKCQMYLVAQGDENDKNWKLGQFIVVLHLLKERKDNNIVLEGSMKCYYQTTQCENKHLKN